MAYSTSAPPVLVIPSRDGSTAAIWAYASADAISVVGGSGYFTNASNLGMKLGDIVIVRETDNSYGSSIHSVSAISSGAATAPAIMAAGTQVANIADASVAHALNATFSDVEVEAALNALGGKINSIIAALEAFSVSASA